MGSGRIKKDDDHIQLKKLLHYLIDLLVFVFSNFWVLHGCCRSLVGYCFDVVWSSFIYHLFDHDYSVSCEVIAIQLFLFEHVCSVIAICLFIITELIKVRTN